MSEIVARVFDLRPDFLVAPTVYDVGVVGAMMLWPADRETQKRKLGSLAAKIVLETANHPQPQTISERRDFFEIIQNHYSRVDAIDEQVKAGFKRGMIAGSLLFESIAASSIDAGSFSFGAIKEKVASRFSAEDHVTIHTINNIIWPDYRSVAPYWSAYISKGKQPDDTPLPCRAEDLGQFLALAQHFRVRGEAVRPRQSSQGFLLRSGETVTIPNGVSLPEMPSPFAFD